MLKILGEIKVKSPSILTDFLEEDASSFELKTEYSKYDHRTWLKYEPTSDGEIVRMELTHLFGSLDFGRSAPDPGHLLRLLSMNIPSFQGSGAYLGVRRSNDTFFVSLNSNPIFLTRWSDEDIAEALTTHLFDLTMALIFEPPAPIKQFGA
jgi:hypothetical protein